jgi:hypothetical protein
MVSAEGVVAVADRRSDSRRWRMAVAFVQEFKIEDRSTKNYDEIARRLDDEPTPAGLIVHSAGFDEDAGVFRIFDIWESQQQADRFQEHVMEIVGEAVPPDAAMPTRTAVYELHDVVKP